MPGISGYLGMRDGALLVEGWAYTTPAFDFGVAHNVSDRTVPFWDPSLLATNDAAFTDPSLGALAALRDEEGVKWLFAATTTADSNALDRLADLRFRQGDFSVYKLR